MDGEEKNPPTLWGECSSCLVKNYKLMRYISRRILCVVFVEMLRISNRVYVKIQSLRNLDKIKDAIVRNTQNDVTNQKNAKFKFI